MRVQPRSARDRVVGLHGGALKVQVTAPPVDGAANRAVIELLAEWLGVPRRAVAVVRGQHGAGQARRGGQRRPAGAWRALESRRPR